jgi:signal transduction histidine kinase
MYLAALVVLGAAACVALAAWVTAAALRRRSRPGGLPLAAATASAGLWLLAWVASALTSPPGPRELLLYGELFFGAALPVFWLLFALEYAGLRDARRGPLAAGLAVFPATTATLVATTDQWSLLSVDLAAYRFGSLYLTDPALGPLAWGLAVYSQALLVAGTVLLTHRSVEGFHGGSCRTVALGSGALALVAATGLTLLDAAPFGLTPLGLVGFVLGSTVAVGRFGLFDAVPVPGRIARRTVLEQLDSGLVVVDDDDTVVDCNAAAREMLELAGEVCALPAREVLPAYDELCAEGVVDTVQYDPGDGTRYLQLRFTPVRAWGDARVGGVVLVQDVTDQQLNLQRLSVFNRVLRHNLRNDANVIAGYADLLPDDQADVASVIRRRARRVVRLGRNSRLIASIVDEEGRDTHPVALPEIVGTAVRELPPGVDPDVDVPPGTYCESALRPVLSALLDNAVRHNSDDDPLVRVSGHRDGDVVELRVEDDGPGIPEGELDAIRSTRETPLDHGSGLGLWLVVWGTRALDATVEFEDRDPEGTRVVLRVPAVQPPGTGDVGGDGPPPARGDAGGRLSGGPWSEGDGPESPSGPGADLAPTARPKDGTLADRWSGTPRGAPR